MLKSIPEITQYPSKKCFKSLFVTKATCPDTNYTDVSYYVHVCTLYACT